MRKRMFFSTCILLITVLIVGCTRISSNPNEGSNEPPQAVGYVNHEELLFITGSYKWHNAIADAPSPEYLIKDSPAPYHVHPDENLTIEFEVKPAEYDVGLWENDRFVPLPSKNKKFRLPSSPGEYILTVTGKWSGGDRAVYAAAVIVD